MMRRFLIRLTVLTSIFAGFLATGIGIATSVAWPTAVFRGVLAAALVGLAGAGASLVLLRTALRRYYEQGRVRRGDPPIRADR
jgi:hypothetical protein